MPDREFDVIVFGATGFAGRLTSQYLARSAPDGIRLALAGRSHDRLAAVRDTLDERTAEVGLLVADVEDEAALRGVAERTRVLITTVGPYVLYGDAAVAACAASGTDYLDLTGEPEFVDTSFVRHHATALDTGARLIHAAGFDSVPHDLGALYTVEQLPSGVPITLSGYVRASGTFSGGTLASALTAFSRPRQNMAAARARRGLEPRTGDRTARAVPGRPHRDPTQHGWALPLPTVDPQIVARSARALERYGPDFRYSHYVSLPRFVTAAGGVVGVAALAGAAQIGPARRALMGRVKAGDGPSAARRAKSWFTVTFEGSVDGQRVVTRVSGGDPGYDETAKMLGEAALSLVTDALPAVAGQVTTAQAFGDALIDRLRRAGIGFEVIG